MKRARGGWRVLIAYGLIAAATQMLWLTFAPITTEAAKHYGVGVGAVGWLAEIFPLLYVLLAIPAGVLLDRWFRPVLAAGGGLVALGGVVRLGGDAYAWVLAGQILVAVAQPVVMSAVGKLAGEYLPVQERALGISIASAGGFVGMLIALLLGPAIGAGNLGLLLALQAGMAVLAAIALGLELRRPGAGYGESTAIQRGVARALWADSGIRTISMLAFLGFGAFVALSTWLQTLLHPDGVTETVAGVLLVGMIISGVIGCVLLPPLVMRRHAESGFMRATVLVGVAGSVALGVLPWLGARALVLLVMGAFLLPALPVILTIAEQRAGPAAGTAGAIVWLAGNLGGLVVALVVQVLVHHELAAFLAMAGIVALGFPLTRRVPAAASLDVLASGREHARGTAPA